MTLFEFIVSKSDEYQLDITKNTEFMCKEIERAIYGDRDVIVDVLETRTIMTISAILLPCWLQKQKEDTKIFNVFNSGLVAKEYGKRLKKELLEEVDGTIDDCYLGFTANSDGAYCKQLHIGATICGMHYDYCIVNSIYLEDRFTPQNVHYFEHLFWVRCRDIKKSKVIYFSECRNGDYAPLFENARKGLPTVIKVEG